MVAAIALLVAVVIFRLVLPSAGPGLAGFTPLAALALCGAAWLPKRLALALPLGALLVSDLILNARYGVSLAGWDMGVRYGALLLVCALGFALQRNRSLGRMLAGSVLGSVLFYMITNTACWLGMSAYAKTPAGWLQAITTGVPGIEPQAWVFFRNALVGDLCFTALFVACMVITSRKVAGAEAVADKVAAGAR